MGKEMYALIEIGNTYFFSKKNIKLFSDIDALAVSMSEKFFCQRIRRNSLFISRKVGRIFFYKEYISYIFSRSLLNWISRALFEKLMSTMRQIKVRIHGTSSSEL